MSQAEIASAYGVSKPRICQRVKRLELTVTAASTLVPETARQHVAVQLDAMEQLNRSLGRVNLLMDACDDWLRDPENPERYDLGPRSGEVDVIYEVEVTRGDRLVVEKRKKKFSELCAYLEGTDDDGARFVGVVKGEYKHADPRELILKTANEVRQTMSTAADIARMLADARAMQALRESVIEEVRRVAPESAARIAEAVRRTIVLHGALNGPGALPPGPTAGA